jgi:hypothetical protein
MGNRAILLAFAPGYPGLISLRLKNLGMSKRLKKVFQLIQINYTIHLFSDNIYYVSEILVIYLDSEP